MMRRLFLILGLSAALSPAFATAPAIFLSNSEDGAQIHCPLDKVVWLNTSAHKYYFRSSKHYAATAKGGFACLQEVKASGTKKGD
jgi:hypothetical protein